jgi:hypothetical protein
MNRSVVPSEPVRLASLAHGRLRESRDLSGCVRCLPKISCTKACEVSPLARVARSVETTRREGSSLSIRSWSPAREGAVHEAMNRCHSERSEESKNNGRGVAATTCLIDSSLTLRVTRVHRSHHRRNASFPARDDTSGSEDNDARGFWLRTAEDRGPRTEAHSPMNSRIRSSIHG